MALIAAHRYECLPGDTIDGVFGKSACWLISTSPNTPRTSNNNAGNAQGRYLNAGETFYQIIAMRVPSSGYAGGRTGRMLNWHDEAVTGYQWGSVSPVAIDINENGNFGGDGVSDQQLTLEYSGSCGGGTHWALPILHDEWNYIYSKITLSTSCSAAVEIYVQNSATSVSDAPVVNLTSKRTLNNTSGFFPGIQFWQGVYIPSNHSSSPNVIGDLSICKFGTSWQTCWDDNPQWVDSIIYSSKQTITPLTSLDLEDFKMPTAISSVLSNPPGGGTPPGGGGGPYASPGAAPSVGFGFSSTGGSTTGGLTSEAIRGSLLTANNDYTISTCKVRLQGSTPAAATIAGTQKMKVHVYAKQGDGTPGALLYSTDELQLKEDNAAGWYDFTFTAPFDADSGDELFATLHVGGPTNGCVHLIFIADAATNSPFRSDAYDNGPPSPFGEVEDQSTARRLFWLEGTVREEPPESGRLQTARRTDIQRTVNPGAHLNLGGGGV